MSLATWLPATLAFLIALIVPIFLRPLLEGAGVIDVPNERSSHEIPALRGGGIAQTLGIMFGLLLALATAEASDRPLLTAVLIAATASAIVGWAEDFRGVKIAIRAALQFAIGAIVTAAIAAYLEQPVVWGIVGGITLIGLINVVNFMDGVNEISAFHGIIAGISFVIIGHLNDMPWMIAAGAALAAVFAAFVPWNLNGTIFLGDVGSYLLGGTIGTVIVLGWMQGVAIYALAAPMAIYLTDTGITLIGRIVAREKWYEAHRDHTYQRFNRAGLSHLGVAATVASASIVTAACGILASQSGGASKFIIAVFGLLVLGGFMALRFMVGLRLPSPSTVGGAE